MIKNCTYCFHNYKQLAVFRHYASCHSQFLHPSGMVLSFSRQEYRWETKSFVTVSQTAKKYAAATAFRKEADTAVTVKNSGQGEILPQAYQNLV